MKEKSNKGIVIVILVLLVAGLSSYIIYDKILKENDNQNKKTYEIDYNKDCSEQEKANSCVRFLTLDNKDVEIEVALIKGANSL